MIIAVSGASGFIGRHLVGELTRARHTVRRLVRMGTGHTEGGIPWDPNGETIVPRAFDEVDAVINLGGASVDRRWTRAQKQRILQSRVRGTKAIAAALQSATARPRILLSGSAIGFYGDRGDELLDEQSTSGTDFLANVAAQWEDATGLARAAGVRTVLMRTGMVLGKGGVLARILPPFRAGVGGRLGTGRQWMSWIAQEDISRAIMLLLENDQAAGPVNLVSPTAARNDEFTRALAKALHRPAILPVPALALVLAFGDMARGAVLASQHVIPQRLNDLGFQFRYPTLDSALAAALQ